MLWLSVRLATLFSTSNDDIADLMLEGVKMGKRKMKDRAIRQNPGTDPHIHDQLAFSKGTKAILWRKMSFQKRMGEQ